MANYVNKYKSTDKKLRALLSSSSNSSENEEMQYCCNENNIEDADSSSSGDSPLPGESSYPSSMHSNDPSSSEDFFPQDENSLREKLAACAVKHKWTQASVNELLSILIDEGHQLPKDSRTLLQTPRSVSIEMKCGGEYSYFGIKNGILRCLSNKLPRNSSIKLKFNIDGLPLFQSSSTQLWPILGCFQESDIFIVAIFKGENKPDCIQDFLEEFLQELTVLSAEGITFDEHNYNVSLQCFLCDAPARAFLKGIILHSGYSSCERCVIHGTYDGRVVFNEETEFAPRDEATYKVFGYNEHHQLVLSPLISSNLEVINSFPLDYMHLVCLGVVRRLAHFWKKGPCGKISANQLNEISNSLISLNGYLPSEFSRQPRGFNVLDRWKATEFRQFLLYTGPVVLRSVLSSNAYCHFIALSFSMSVLLQEDVTIRISLIEYVKELLRRFVFNAKYIYGNTFSVYNVHNLLHIADDCVNHGCSLNEINCFPFENFLQRVKRSVRNASNPLVQIAKRQIEFENIYQALPKKQLKCKVSNGKKDSCFMTNTSVVFIKFVNNDGSFNCDSYKFKYMESVYNNPVDSKELQIMLLPNKNARKYSKVVLIEDDLVRKCICLQEPRGKAIFPLLHEIERQ